MKKLTKVLSLVLVIAMVVSLCVVGVSAKTFSKDGDKINENYKEAVDVMSGIGIISGTDTAGTTFNPTGNFTRAAAAKIIAYMQLGVAAAEALKGTGNAFKDVPASNWAAPYINYCAQKGIIAGYGNGNFGPNDTLTGYAWAKMLLCSVGYGVNKEYSGASWSINVAKDALSKGVFSKVLSASTNEVITREQATQMAFNTLTKLPTVTYSALYGDYIDGVTGTVTTGSASNNNTYKGTLGYKVYGLQKQYSLNGYGYNGHKWYKDLSFSKTNLVSGWYMDDDVVDSNYTSAGMTGSALYKAYTWNDKITVVVNGEVDGTTSGTTFTATTYKPADFKNNNTKVLAAYAGAQFNFVDTDGDGAVDEIVVVVTYFGEVTGITAATSLAPRYATVKIYNHDSGADAIVKVESETLAKGDFVSVIPAGNSNLGTAGTVVEPLAIEKLTAKTSAVDKYDATSVTLGGTAVNYSFIADAPDGASYSFKGATYDFYIVNGFVIGERLNTGSALNYAYLAQSSSNDANTSLINAADGMLKVKLVYADGTAEVLNYKVAKATSAIPVDATTSNHVGANDGEAIAANAYYFVITNAAGQTCYYNVDGKNDAGALANLTGIAALADGNAVSYTKGTDGTVTLSAVTYKTINSVKSGAATTNTVTLKANVATSGINGMVVNSATKLVVIAADGTATTTTGYANFPAAGKTYTAGTNCGAIFYQYVGATLTDIVIVTAKAADASAVYGMYLGADKVTVDSNGYNAHFLVNGTDTAYTMVSQAAAISMTKGALYCLSFTDGKATPVALAGTATTAQTLATDTYCVTYDKAVAAQAVSAATAEYFQVGTTVYYFGKDSQTNLVDTANATMANSTVAAGDFVTVVYTVDSGVNTVVAVFITTAHA